MSADRSANTSISQYIDSIQHSASTSIHLSSPAFHISTVPDDLGGRATCSALRSPQYNSEREVGRRREEKRRVVKGEKSSKGREEAPSRAIKTVLKAVNRFPHKYLPHNNIPSSDSTPFIFCHKSNRGERREGEKERKKQEKKGQKEKKKTSFFKNTRKMKQKKKQGKNTEKNTVVRSWDEKEEGMSGKACCAVVEEVTSRGLCMSQELSRESWSHPHSDCRVCSPKGAAGVLPSLSRVQLTHLFFCPRFVWHPGWREKNVWGGASWLKLTLLLCWMHHGTSTF